MATPFNVMRNLASTRNYGGTAHSINADPYISGYHYTWWNLPETLRPKWLDSWSGLHAQTVAPIQNREKAATILQGACVGVTPPGGQINKVEYTGIGGTKWSVPGNIDYGSSVSFRFIEFSGVPILRIIGGWVRMMRDYKMGISELQDTQYTKTNYSATVLYWTTKPDGVSVENCSCFSGVFPIRDPQELYSGDVTTVDKLEVELEFNCDFNWKEPWVTRACEAKAQIMRSQSMNRFGSYGNDRSTLP